MPKVVVITWDSNQEKTPEEVTALLNLAQSQTAVTNVNSATNSKICCQCGKPFSSRHKLQKVCSKACRKKFQKDYMVTYMANRRAKDKQDAAKAQPEKPGVVTKTCEQCGIEYQVPKLGQEKRRFCTRGCANRHRVENLLKADHDGQPVKKCENSKCRKLFHPSHHKQRYCSIGCRVRANWNRYYKNSAAEKQQA